MTDESYGMPQSLSRAREIVRAAEAVEIAVMQARLACPTNPRTGALCLLNHDGRNQTARKPKRRAAS